MLLPQEYIPAAAYLGLLAKLSRVGSGEMPGAGWVAVPGMLLWADSPCGLLEAGGIGHWSTQSCLWGRNARRRIPNPTCTGSAPSQHILGRPRPPGTWQSPALCVLPLCYFPFKDHMWQQISSGGQSPLSPFFLAWDLFLSACAL